jgi:hypothetical protein
MKACRNCDIMVDSPIGNCPLCNTALHIVNDSPEIAAFPDLRQKAQKNYLIFRILLVLSLSICIISLTVDLLTPPNLSWSLLVVVNMLYMWIALGSAFLSQRRLGFNVFVQVLSLAALLFVISRLVIPIAHWALEYIIPFCFISGTFCITIITVVKRMQVREFVLYFILTALLGFIPLLFVLFDLVSVTWPAIGSAVYSGLSLIGIFIFADHATKMELRKRFHF